MATRRSHLRHRGFTLVEVVACLVILGILATVSAPSFFNNQTFASRGYADELASSLRYAQRIAIASSCPVQLNVTAAGYDGWQHVNFSPNACNGAWTLPVLRADNTTLSGVPPDGVIVNPNVVIEFLPNGALAGASAAIAVDAFTVNVDAASGRVSVQ